jgi:hypothetical protein
MGDYMTLLDQLVDNGEVYLYEVGASLPAIHRDAFCAHLLGHLARTAVDSSKYPLTPITCGAFFAMANRQEFAQLFPDLVWQADANVAEHIATIFCGILRMDPINSQYGANDISLYCLHAAFFAQFYLLNPERFVATFSGDCLPMLTKSLSLIARSIGAPVNLDAYQKAVFYEMLQATGVLDYLPTLYHGNPVQQFLVRFEARQIRLLDRFLHPGSGCSATLNPAVGVSYPEESQKHLIIASYARYQDIGQLQASVAKYIQHHPHTCVAAIQKHPELRVLLELLAFYPGKIHHHWFSHDDGVSAARVIMRCCEQAAL